MIIFAYKQNPTAHSSSFYSCFGLFYFALTVKIVLVPLLHFQCLSLFQISHHLDSFQTEIDFYLLEPSFSWKLSA
jgi:hypothetical protein